MSTQPQPSLQETDNGEIIVHGTLSELPAEYRATHYLYHSGNTTKLMPRGENALAKPASPTIQLPNLLDDRNPMVELLSRPAPMVQRQPVARGPRVVERGRVAGGNERSTPQDRFEATFKHSVLYVGAVTLVITVAYIGGYVQGDTALIAFMVSVLLGTGFSTWQQTTHSQPGVELRRAKLDHAIDQKHERNAHKETVLHESNRHAEAAQAQQNDHAQKMAVLQMQREALRMMAGHAPDSQPSSQSRIGGSHANAIQKRH